MFPLELVREAKRGEAASLPTSTCLALPVHVDSPGKGKLVVEAKRGEAASLHNQLTFQGYRVQNVGSRPESEARRSRFASSGLEPTFNTR